MSYDRADFDYSTEAEPLPKGHAGTHIGMFLAWAVLNGLDSDHHRERSAELLARLADLSRQVEGLRPGERTDKYLSKIVNRITLVGAVFLALVAVLPFIVQKATGVQVGLSATGLLIVVGVAVDTMKQLEGQLAIRGYDKFIRR